MQKRRMWAILLLSALLAALLICLGLHGPTPPMDKPQSSAEMGLVLQEEEDGLYVLAVSEQGMAVRTGIQPGDYLLRLGNTALDSMQQLDEMMRLSDRPCQMTLRRREREMTVLLP